MLRTFRLIAGAVLVLAASAAIAQGPAGNDLYPLKKGNKWVYKVDAQEVTVEVVGIEKVDKDDLIKLDTKVGGQTKASEYLLVKADGVYRAKVNNDKIEPPVKIIPIPAKKGDSWKIESKVGTQTVKGEFKISDDKTKVMVPAGTFENAILIEGNDLDIAGTKTSVKKWFVPGKGIVKLTYTIQQTESTLELKEFTPAK